MTSTMPALALPWLLLSQSFSQKFSKIRQEEKDLIFMLESTTEMLTLLKGHASLSIANLSFLMYYLMGKMHILRPNGGELYKVVVAVFPLGIAWWISVSRTQDNHHNFSDIVGGMVMGFPFGLISYLLCYPTLTSPDCDVPKLRSDSDDSGGHHSLQEELF
uniref:Phosphatidic acid phosphatase type 2/haloperoxidase domain-containing protein n=1 Tax=Paramoeba aestuarina TaxID=180227 RepID=A0A7S4PN67_9EUKA|mmetsp:Transcript_9469/g.14364  ORF Transcript_9469/g.14364 Transcript_9469/m.14364 type:complete len:161 (+) Transcript_9469:301-783(+)